MKLNNKSLEIKKKNLGEDHTSVANTYNNMAFVYDTQGKLDEKMKLYSKSLEIKKKNLGENHTSVANTYNNMALVYSQQGKLDEAIKLYNKSLEITFLAKVLAPSSSSLLFVCDDAFIYCG